MKVNKIYKYKSNKYKMRPMNLGLMHKAAPLLARYRMLHYEYTKDIDMSPAEELRSRIDELKTAISQLEAGGNPDAARINELKRKLDEAENEMKSSANLNNLMKLYRDSEGLAMYELITDAGLTKPLLNDVLIPLENENKLQNDCGLDFDDAEIFDFIKEVMTDFFSYTLQARPK